MKTEKVISAPDSESWFSTAFALVHILVTLPCNKIGVGAAASVLVDVLLDMELNENQRKSYASVLAKRAGVLTNADGAHAHVVKMHLERAVLGLTVGLQNDTEPARKHLRIRVPTEIGRIENYGGTD